MENNQATAVIMYQAASSTSDEVNKAVQDALNHNNWFNATFTVRNIDPAGELFQPGTEFWVCSSTGSVTFDDSGAISLAGPTPPVSDSSESWHSQPDGVDRGFTYRSVEEKFFIEFPKISGNGSEHWKAGTCFSRVPAKFFQTD
jgi:hypothetical protein